MAESASLNVEESHGVKIVSFPKQTTLDVETTPPVGRQLYAIVEDGSVGKVIIDFANVHFLSSQALGVMLTLRRKADKAGVTVALARIRPELARVFEITNLDQLFGFHGTVDDAIARLTSDG